MAAGIRKCAWPRPGCHPSTSSVPFGAGRFRRSARETYSVVGIDGHPSRPRRCGLARVVAGRHRRQKFAKAGRVEHVLQPRLCAARSGSHVACCGRMVEMDEVVDAVEARGARERRGRRRLLQAFRSTSRRPRSQADDGNFFSQNAGTAHAAAAKSRQAGALRARRRGPRAAHFAARTLRQIAEVLLEPNYVLAKTGANAAELLATSTTARRGSFPRWQAHVASGEPTLQGRGAATRRSPTAGGGAAPRPGMRRPRSRARAATSSTSGTRRTSRPLCSVDGCSVVTCGGRRRHRRGHGRAPAPPGRSVSP